MCVLPTIPYLYHHWPRSPHQSLRPVRLRVTTVGNGAVVSVVAVTGGMEEQ